MEPSSKSPDADNDRASTPPGAALPEAALPEARSSANPPAPPSSGSDPEPGSPDADPPESGSSESGSPQATAPATAVSDGPRPSIAFLLFWAALFLIADVASKAWAVSKLEGTGTRRIVVIDGFFNFDLAKNHGGAFGFLGEQSEMIRLPFFFTISAVAVFFVVSLFRKLEPGQTALKWALPLVLGGAAGNLIDRVRHQYVIDFLDVYLTFIKVDGGRPYHWPTFNVADIWIVAGVGLMAVDMLTHRPKPKTLAPRVQVKPDAEA